MALVENTIYNKVVFGGERTGAFKSTGWLRSFRMEWLGLMFAGQRIAATFNEMIKPAEDLVGLSEIQAAAMAEMFMPAAEAEIEALERQVDQWDNMSDAQRKATAIGALWARDAAEGMMKIAALIFTLHAGAKFLLTDLPMIFSAMKAGAAALSIGMGPLALIIGVIIGAIALLYVAWTNNWGGIQEKMKAVFDWLKEHFGWLWDILVDIGRIVLNVLMIAFKTAWDSIVATITWAWNLLKPILEPLFNFLKGIGEAIAGWFGGAAEWLKGVATAMGLPGLQHGGIVTRPTMALIGEKGPEAVIPLGSLGSMGGITMNIYTTSKLSREELPALTRELAERFGAELRMSRMGRGGI